MIVVFLPYGIGDIIMAIPGLIRLGRKFGSEHITVILANDVQREIIERLHDLPIKVIVYKQSSILGTVKLYWQILAMQPKYIYAPMINAFKSRLLFFLCLCKPTFVPSKVVKSRFLNLHPFKYSIEDFPGHQVNYLINFLNMGHGKINTTNAIPSELTISDDRLEDKKSTNATFRIVVGISCGQAERHKIPSTVVFAELLNKISDNLSCEFYLIGNHHDANLLNDLASQLNSNVNYVMKIYDSIKDTFDDLRKFDLGISGTTGQGHIMSTVDMPMLILAGVTDPWESGPYVTRAVVVDHKLECSPCYQATFKYGCKKIKCMDLIDVDLALESVIKLLEDDKFGDAWLLKNQRQIPKNTLQIKRVLLEKGIHY